MRPQKPETPNGDLFRSTLAAIIDPEHELLRLAELIDWGRFDDAFGPLYHETKGRRGLPTRLMAGIHLLKHMKGLSDEETCATWLENPHFQASVVRHIFSTACRDYLGRDQNESCQPTSVETDHGGQ